jgi:iron complex outermembrane receptor protein
MLLAAGAAHAADAPATTTPTMTGAGAEGTDVSQLVVTAEANRAAKDAPAKASLDQVQPESIISRQYIEQAVSEVGDYTSVALIAPSISGIGSNGGGIGDYNKVTMRGFQDGQYNLTYDQISFGDTNDPTHHPADYWPASTIGAMVVDRGPGAAGDLGQANFGGAIHMFSPTVSDTFGVQQKLTYGSFNTVDSVTTINTGDIGSGAKLLLNFNLRNSDGELTHSGGYMLNQMAKFVAPIGANWTFTALAAQEYTKFSLADAGPGATWHQMQLYGQNFALTDIPGDEHNYNWNYEAKGTDFEYVDLKGTVIPSLTAEDQLYTYYYSNKTTAVNDITGLIGGPNTSLLQNTTKGGFGPTAATNPNDVGGYDKLNLYRVWGNVVRINKEWSFGTLKVGSLQEISSTDRHNGFIDLSNGGAPDIKFQPLSKYPLLAAPTNYKLQENSKWFQYQVFADFEIHIGDNLKLTPGVKYVDFTRNVNAANESVAGGAKNQPLVAQNTYTSPLYFFTANYKVTHDWAFYAQVGTAFLIPSLSALYTNGANLQNLQPQKTLTYQGGTVYTHGNLTADADLYNVDVSNLYVACNILDPITGNPTNTASGFCNVGKAKYNGFEGEIAYALPYGVSLFANGSSNVAKAQANPGNPAEGIAAAPAQGITNAPRWTAAAGVIYNSGPWAATMTYKNSGTYVAGYNSTTGHAISLPGFDTLDASGSYDFGHFKLKLAVFNLADKRAITSFSGQVLYSPTDTGLYQLQSGRTIMGTLIAKF